MQDDPNNARVVLLETPGLVDIAGVSIGVCGVQKALNGCRVTVEAHHRTIKRTFDPRTAFARDRVRLIAKGKTLIVEGVIFAHKVRNSSFTSGSEGCVARCPRWFEGNGS